MAHIYTRRALSVLGRSHGTEGSGHMTQIRSYDPGTGTYLGYDGYPHPCPWSRPSAGPRCRRAGLEPTI